jgi:hypothetical protein
MIGSTFPKRGKGFSEIWIEFHCSFKIGEESEKVGKILTFSKHWKDNRFFRFD